MNKIFITFIIFIFIPISINGQDIREFIYNSKYGNIYKEYREAKESDFIWNCKNRGFTESVSNFIKSMTQQSSMNTGGFGFSYVTSNDSYGRFLSELVTEARENMYKLPRAIASGSNCTKTYHDFIQLYLEKFEILLAYEVEINKFHKVYTKKMLAEKEAKISYVKDSFNIIEREVKNLINIDEELELLNKEKINNSNSIINNQNNKLENIKSSKNKEIFSIKTKFQKKYTELENQKKSKIKNLPLENYSKNKEKINQEFKPLFQKLISEKNRKISTLETNKNKVIEDLKSVNSNESEKLVLTLNKKILDRELLIQSEIDKRMAEIEIEKRNSIAKTNSIVKNKYKLTEKKAFIINNHKNEILEIDKKIKEFVSKKNKAKKVKKGIRSLFKF